MNRIFRSAIFYLILIVAVVWIYSIYRNGADAPRQIESVNQFEQLVENGDIASAKFLTKDEKVAGEFADGGKYELFLPKDTVDTWAEFALRNDVPVSADPQQGSVFLSVLFQFLPILIIVGFFFFLMQQMQGGGNRVMSFGKSKARLVTKDQPKITFTDVAGLDEAIEELQEIKEYLEGPQKFQAMGAKIPKGVLLYGPPGAGLGGGHDEREQTLNQLLVEMDGFDIKGGVILIAATNRPDILDPALLRPGRFDRQIVVDRPDLNGRVG